jgi:hypothetical protein
VSPCSTGVVAYWNCSAVGRVVRGGYEKVQRARGRNPLASITQQGDNAPGWRRSRPTEGARPISEPAIAACQPWNLQTAALPYTGTPLLARSGDMPAMFVAGSHE